MCWSVSHWSSCYGFKYDVGYPYLFNHWLITLLDLADDFSSRLLLISTMQLYAVVLFLYISFSLSLRDLQSEEHSSTSSCLLPSPDESDPRSLALLLSNSFFAWLVNSFFALYGKYGTAKIPGNWNEVCMFATCFVSYFRISFGNTNIFWIDTILISHNQPLSDSWHGLSSSFQ